MEQERRLERELQAATLAGRRISLYQAQDTLLFVQCSVASLETIYTHATKNRLRRLLHIFVMCHHVANKIVKEKGYQFMSGRHVRGSKESNREGLEGGKEGSDVILF